MKTLIATTALLALTATSVAAQGRNCGPREAVVERLAGHFLESRVGMGLAANGQVVEVWRAETGSWTVTVSSPQGLTCLAASGQSWQDLVEDFPAAGEQEG